MSKEEIEKQLKLSKRQSKDERYDYLCSEFNAINYCINLEKYTNKLQQENEKLHHYKTLYQSLKKQKEELISWLKEGKRVSIAHENMRSVNFISLVLSKLEELEQPKKELLKPSHYDEDIDIEYELYKARKFIEEDKKRKFGEE